jgi:hypothetical protein
MRRGRGLTWVWWVLVVALLAVPVGTATAEPPGAATTGISACTAHNAGDSCSVNNETATSVTVTQTISPDHPLCPPDPNCVFSYHLTVGQSGYNNVADHAVGVGSASTNCAGHVLAGNGDFASPPAGSFICTTVFSWSATEYPINWSVTLLEQNGGAGPVNGGGHQATFSRPSPNPTASFTYAQTSTPGEFVFTSTSVQGSGPLEERWYSPDDHSQSPGPQRTWTHTFPAPGTYTINLEVSDAGPGSASATAEVTWDGSTPSPPSTTLTVQTALKPTSDKGRFQVTVDGQIVLPTAGNGDHVQLVVAPGPHVISERGVPATNLFKYAVSMTCTNGPSTVTTKGTVYLLQVARGTHTDCTITNKATKHLHCVVPDLTGKKLTKATKALRKAHCAVGSLSPRHPRKKATVTSFSPTVGSVRHEGTEVKLTFG